MIAWTLLSSKVAEYVEGNLLLHTPTKKNIYRHIPSRHKILPLMLWQFPGRIFLPLIFIWFCIELNPKLEFLPPHLTLMLCQFSCLEGTCLYVVFLLENAIKIATLSSQSKRRTPTSSSSVTPTWSATSSAAPSRSRPRPGSASPSYTPPSRGSQSGPTAASPSPVSATEVTSPRTRWPRSECWEFEDAMLCWCVPWIVIMVKEREINYKCGF